MVVAFFGEPGNELFTRAHQPNSKSQGNEDIVFLHTVPGDTEREGMVQQVSTRKDFSQPILHPRGSEKWCTKRYHYYFEYMTKPPGIVFFINQLGHVYSGAPEEGSLKDFIKRWSLSTQTVFDYDESKAHGDVVILFRDPTDKYSLTPSKMFEAASKTLETTYFAFSDEKTDIAKKMGVTKEDLPTLRAITPSGYFKCS